MGLKINKISESILKAETLEEFESLIREHEEIISSTLKMTKVKELMFSDYWGEVKSLGAWGGDFVLVTSKKTKEETKKYFSSKKLDIFFSYEEFILENSFKSNDLHH